MANTTTTKELRNMTPADLAKEINTLDGEVVKLRLGVKLGKEKDSAKYIREKKQLARMKTIQSELKNATPKAEKEEKPASKEAKKSVSSRGEKAASTTK